MVVVRSLYYLVMKVNPDGIPEMTVNHDATCRNLHLAADAIKSEIYEMAVSGSYIHLFLNIDQDISLAYALNNLRHLSSSGGLGRNEVDGSLQGLWDDRIFVKSVSPEQKEVIKNYIRYISTETISAKYNSSLPFSLKSSGLQGSAENFYHIILITSRGRRILRTNFRGLLYEKIKEIYEDMGGKLRNTASMRNHVHVLGNLPVNVPVRSFVETLKSRLLEWMHSNRHFRSMEGWSDSFVAYTVSLKMLGNEEYEVCHQDERHRGVRLPNEMWDIIVKLNLTQSPEFLH